MKCLLLSLVLLTACAAQKVECDNPFVVNLVSHNIVICGEGGNK